MFKKFDDEAVSGYTQLKQSVQKGIKNKLIELWPAMKDYADDIMPKKEPIRLAKCHDHVEILVGANGEHLFFRQREGPWIPTLRLIHKYPFICPIMQVDKGAIPYVLSGANIMCPGLTSKGGAMTPGVGKDYVVVVTAEGKEHALAVGITNKSSSQIAKENRGVAIENIHYLNDGLWRLKLAR